jgi:hypothetical protein
MGQLGQEVDLGICSRLTLRVKPVKAGGRRELRLMLLTSPHPLPIPGPIDEC